MDLSIFATHGTYDHCTRWCRGASYAYSATLVGANYQRFCRGSSGPAALRAACTTGLETVERLRSEQPMLLWDDALHGRTTVPPKDWAGLALVGGQQDEST